APKKPEPAPAPAPVVAAAPAPPPRPVVVPPKPKSTLIFRGFTPPERMRRGGSARPIDPPDDDVAGFARPLGGGQCPWGLPILSRVKEGTGGGFHEGRDPRSPDRPGRRLPPGPAPVPRGPGLGLAGRGLRELRGGVEGGGRARARPGDRGARLGPGRG